MNDIIDFGKIRSGNFKRQFKSVDLREAIEQVIQIKERATRQKNIDVKVDYGNLELRDYNVTIDSSRFQQVLVHLLNHCVQSQTGGAISIKVKLCFDNGWNCWRLVASLRD